MEIKSKAIIAKDNSGNEVTKWYLANDNIIDWVYTEEDALRLMADGWSVLDEDSAITALDKERTISRNNGREDTIAHLVNSALNYSPEEYDRFEAETGWRDWMLDYMDATYDVKYDDRETDRYLEQDEIDSINELLREAWDTAHTVHNSYGIRIDYSLAVELMDDEIRERLANKIAPCTDQEFFDAYAEAHFEEFGEEWELSKSNPCY
jgi:hypothetical protein